MLNLAQAQAVKNKIIEYYHVLATRPQEFCPKNQEADRLVKENPLAFVFAVILDQGAKAERIWEIPWHLKSIMEHLDPYKIAKMSEGEIQQVFEKLPSKPRCWKTAALRIRRACLKIVKEYDGKAENVWVDNPRAKDLQARLDDFNGIGQKKASMGTRILRMDLAVSIRNLNEIDVSYDVMVRRVFLRAGLCDSDSQDSVVQAARQINPDFPGLLDYPCWDIGRNWCKPQKPRCNDCYISGVCAKIGV